MPFRCRFVKRGDEMDISLEIHCDRCGSANLAFGDGGDSTEIGCNDCGLAHGTVEALKAELVEQLLARSAEALRRDLGTLR